MPDVGPDAALGAAFDVVDSGPVGKGVPFVVDDDSALPGRSRVVVIGAEFEEVWLEGGVFDSPIEPEHLGSVAVDDLDGAQQPVFEILLVGCCFFPLGGSVEVDVLRVEDVGIEAGATVHEEPV